jgi:hypothetical protein
MSVRRGNAEIGNHVSLAKYRPVCDPLANRMALHLTNRRYVEPQDSRDPAALQKPWLKKEMFTDPATKLQLFAVAEGWLGYGQTDATVFSANHQAFGGASEIPIEYWDIADDTGRIVFQLWLFDCGSGTLFADGTDRIAAVVCDYGFETTDAELASEMPATLASDLAIAWQAVSNESPHSVLVEWGNVFEG